MKRIILAVALVLGTAACAPAGLGTPPAAGAAPSAQGFTPVTIEHKFGSTEIKAPPQRVVSVGLVEQDALLALGVVPVGTTDSPRSRRPSPSPRSTSTTASPGRN
ncbi:hypothetical protein [Nonomuraea typhae]|uniref:Fe/B12 periplasmic-binding domain-containing protein n=1 Tax=Nonomuraea typhae TaxID=2603600 RepID=A0ABW7YPF1_9ACTN